MKIISKDEVVSKVETRIDGHEHAFPNEKLYLTASAPVRKDILEQIVKLYLSSFEYRCKSGMLMNTRETIQWQQGVELDNGYHLLVDMKVERGRYSDGWLI